MSMGNTFENSLMLLIFNNQDIANIGDATGLRGSSVAGSLYFALHTADPGEAGSAITNETAYTGYARQAAARNSGALVVTNNSVSPAADATFPVCSASPGGDLTHFSIVNTSSGAGIILFSGPITPVIAMTIGKIPVLKSTTYAAID